ncbi:hypothetical protein EDB81DRAFT_888184 [Dactylonectria macrodidyma]|uniref:Zn(2)-C6 fungal-type domain-containing protein n=1 Tax=Dactylonectria macrodidyma TaxID=307937 RepID=A0A9P9E238_9HYPO|nr:hypothetical protein EDB81DRAFT_888184 [Dactylonectria macrodidyma]
MPSQHAADRARRTSLRRPNGRPQACEPCRKRKVACDNGQPICHRCRKASRSNQCQYIVDPRMSILSPSTPGRSLSSPASSHSPPQPRTGSTRTPSTEDIGPFADPLPCNPSNSLGYLGPTSFCNIYEEAEKNLSIARRNDCGCNPQQAKPVPAIELPELSPQMLETCLVVLRKVPRREEGQRLCSVNANPNELWLHLVGHRTLNSFYDTFGHHLGDDRTGAGLGEISKRMCYNTSQPLSEDEEEPERWWQQFSGLNFRWEALGIIFTYWAFGMNVPTPLRPELLRDPRYKSHMTDYLEAIDVCIEICRSLTNGNSFLLFVLLRRAIIESMRSGDASPLVWRFHGDTVSLLTFLGLHAQADGPNYRPTICSEWKRRLVANIFSIDKALASFTGRPPALGRRYMLTAMPLDLADHELLGNKDSLTRAMKQLDAGGWNTSGVVFPSTICRARSMIAFFRDELFEIALGHGLETTVDTLLDILRRENMFDSRLLVHLEHLQNHFFIYRLLIQRGHDSQVDLVAVSFEMVSLALLFWTHLDRLPRIVTDLKWLVMAYAAPSGGILSQELLKQSAAPYMVPAGGKQGPSRFAIIEKLFLLVSFLDWVSPNAPNGDLCRSCKRIIRHVLEKVTQDATPASGFPQAAPTLEPWNWDLGDTSIDFEFDLLDTFEWLRP